MAKRKTQYTINFTADPALVNQTIANWLNVNRFVYKEKYDTRYYQCGDGFWTVAECFEYYIYGNQLTIYAYLKSPKKPFPLDNGMVGAANTTPYMNKIKQLVSAIENLSAVASSPYAQQQGYSQESQIRQMQMTNQNFADEAEKRNRNTAIGGFIFGILNVIIMFVGYIYWFLVIVGIVLSVQGLQAKSKIVSIAALVLHALVVVMFFLVRAGIVFL